MPSRQDVFNQTAFDPSTWSDSVTYAAPANGYPARVIIAAPGPDDVTLDGTVAAAGDTVVLTTRLGLQLGLSAVCDVAGGLIVTDGQGTYYAFFSQPVAAGAAFDAAGGFGHFADAGSTTACFVAGTRIETLDGPRAVEDLRAGDLVLTADGHVPARIVWTGARRVRCDRHPAPWDVRPFRVQAGALAAGVPRRDLFLSPDHALWTDGALVPVRHLNNGASIRQMPFAAVSYHHIELAHHATVLAEGAAAETFLDTGNRHAFEGDVMTLHPVFGPGGTLRAYAPLTTCGPRLEAVRTRLLHRALALGHAITSDAALEVWADDQRLALHGAGPTLRTLVPPGTRRLRLVSRTARAAETAAAGTDRRVLGVCVLRLRVGGTPIRLGSPALDRGWHADEGGWRWTDGAAEVALPPGLHGLLELMRGGELRYWTGSDPAARNRVMPRPARSLALT